VAVPMDKYLAGPQVASQQSIEGVVQQMLQQVLAQREDAINQAFGQVSAKFQQLEATLVQVAAAVQQPKMTPFEVALKTLAHFGDDEVDEPAKRCHDKAVALVERWLDAGLATSEAGSGDARGAPPPAREAEEEIAGGGGPDQSPPPVDREEALPAEND
jgi:hypothetical protein